MSAYQKALEAVQAERFALGLERQRIAAEFHQRLTEIDLKLSDIDKVLPFLEVRATGRTVEWPEAEPATSSVAPPSPAPAAADLHAPAGYALCDGRNAAIKEFLVSDATALTFVEGDAKADNLTDSQRKVWRAIAALIGDGAPTYKQIAETSAVAAGSVGTIVPALEKKGYLERTETGIRLLLWPEDVAKPAVPAAPPPADVPPQVEPLVFRKTASLERPPSKMAAGPTPPPGAQGSCRRNDPRRRALSQQGHRSCRPGTRRRAALRHRRPQGIRCRRPTRGSQQVAAEAQRSAVHPFQWG